MRDDFKNKFSNNRRVFSFNHLYIRFFARYFYLPGGRGTGKLPRDFRGMGGGAAFLANSGPRDYYYYFILFIFCVHALPGSN